ncbi:hypothetical protein BGZ83_011667 [Gryganskiella cystojenkinii]|nr:hypothetical protein BGZ83_011667 [Gryganskiella cystojenkinii]
MEIEGDDEEGPKEGSSCQRDVFAAPGEIFMLKVPEKLRLLDDDPTVVVDIQFISTSELGKGEDKVMFEVDRRRAVTGEDADTLDRDRASGDRDKDEDKSGTDVVAVDAKDEADVDVAGERAEEEKDDVMVVPLSAILVNFVFEARRRNLTALLCRVGPGVDPRRMISGE